jgi:hypothetical protein
MGAILFGLLVFVVVILVPALLFGKAVEHVVGRALSDDEDREE